MNKAILISIQPKWCEIIASGRKTIEVRKTAPKLQTPFKCYIYCTAERPYGLHLTFPRGDGTNYLAHKKVIGEFMCDKVDEYICCIMNPCLLYEEGVYYDEWGYEAISDETLKQMCLEDNEINDYGQHNTLYGWHIFDLKIYDKPKELREFRKPDIPCHAIEEQNGNLIFYDGWTAGRPITRPPQSWCYVEELSE